MSSFLSSIIMSADLLTWRTHKEFTCHKLQGGGVGYSGQKVMTGLGLHSEKNIYPIIQSSNVFCLFISI